MKIGNLTCSYYHDSFVEKLKQDNITCIQVVGEDEAEVLQFIQDNKIEYMLIDLWLIPTYNKISFNYICDELSKIHFPYCVIGVNTEEFIFDKYSICNKNIIKDESKYKLFIDNIRSQVNTNRYIKGIRRI